MRVEGIGQKALILGHTANGGIEMDPGGIAQHRAAVNLKLMKIVVRLQGQLIDAVRMPGALGPLELSAKGRGPGQGMVVVAEKRAVVAQAPMVALATVGQGEIDDIGLEVHRRRQQGRPGIAAGGAGKPPQDTPAVAGLALELRLKGPTVIEAVSVVQGQVTPLLANIEIVEAVIQCRHIRRGIAGYLPVAGQVQG